MPVSFDFTPAPKARRLALSGFFGTAILCCLSQLNFVVAGGNWTFAFLPCVGIFLWPKGANSTVSLVSMFVLGLFQDHISFGPIGLWPLIWTTFFLIYRPEARSRNYALLAMWGRSVIGIVIVMGLHFLLGSFVFNQLPDGKIILMSGLTAIALFPAVWAVQRQVFRLLDKDYKLGALS